MSVREMLSSKNLIAILPGLMMAVVIAMSAGYLSDHHGAPVMLFALLLGIAFNFLSETESRYVAGIQFSSNTLLRIGVALLGARITFEQIVQLGFQPIVVITVLITLTILFGWGFSKLLGLEKNFGVLTGGAVAICGASAALAISSILPDDKSRERNTLFTVIGVTTLSTLAMIIYPVIVVILDLDDVQAAFFLGATIHDVAQVIGAGYSISDEVGDVATYSKLLRVAMLLPVVSVLSLLFSHRRSNDERKNAPLPLFLVVFALIVLVNSLGFIPETIRLGMIEVSRWCLVIAVASLGLKTSLKKMAELGVKPIVLIVSETLFIAIIALLAIYYLR